MMIGQGPGSIIPPNMLQAGTAANALLGQQLQQQVENQINQLKKRRRQRIDPMTGLGSASIDLGIGMSLGV